jgi:GWxTD domain-containing protein
MHVQKEKILHMNKLIIVIAVFFCTGLQAQVLRNLNFRYLYNPDEAVSLTWNVIRENNSYTVFYDLKLIDSLRFNTVTIQFETRESSSEKSGKPLVENHTILHNSNAHKSGVQSFSVSANHKILFAKVIVTEAKKNNLLSFYKNLPTNNSIYATVNNRPVSSSYINQTQTVTFSGFENTRLLQASYYEDAFPAAAPAFSTAQARVPKVIKPDSIFLIDPKTAITLSKRGLYLVQQDTASALGVAFRVEKDYPKLGTLQSLVGPLVYVCTKQEYEKIKIAGNDKKKFDQVILSITGNTERARIFMRNYFKRVEAANQYFSSYKEGWKTDRGMIYIIYGIPDEVYLFEDREVWEYKNEILKERFQFVKSATIFDPENYVLIREKGFTNDWYNMIDLWRKARF